jgi:hypothetical protein
LEILEKILTDKLNRKQLISEFQILIWNAQDCDETLSQLAYDLDFYEPDSEIRKEDKSYYGDEILEDVIKLAIKKLNIKR